MKTISYRIVCPSCQGLGYIRNPGFNASITASGLTVICPACEGTKVVIVTETS
jgi:Zn finger protein HypA/HybF involved in hydrogenase expression